MGRRSVVKKAKNQVIKPSNKNLAIETDRASAAHTIRREHL